ncbi:MAG: hypothetical protein BHW09_00560 [Clostridium sp. CAG:245_30_32]|jgi:hypothetical protein|nr:MAG: hypothetical protein BHW09_00560 [Clostridium sp. CAG:245_30_32]
MKNLTRKQKIIARLVVILCIGILIVTFTVDYNRVKNQKKPIFCIKSPAGGIMDGGTIEYFGLGYKVIDFHTIAGFDDIKIGTWFMDYNDFEEEIKAYEKKFEENLSTNEENNSDLENVIMKVDSITIKPTSISIIIINNNDNEIGYGEEYKIQKNINGEWEYLDYLPNTVWNDIAYIIKANSQTTKKLNLENTYGELEKGTYRVIKTVFFENGKKTDIYSTEFEIK